MSESEAAARAAPVTRAALANRDIGALLRSRHTVLWVVTRDELAVERALIGVAGGAQYEPVIWDCKLGLQSAEGVVIDGSLAPLDNMLDYIRDSGQRRVYILRDLHEWLGPVEKRAIRNLGRKLESVPRSEARSILILSPSNQVPLELKCCTVVIEYPLPERAEIAAALDVVAGEQQVVNGQRERAIDSALGLNTWEASNCFAKSLVTCRDIDPKLISDEKKRVIAGTAGIDWYEPDPRGLDAVGGLELLKDWLRQRKLAFSQKARDFGLPIPKGVLLLGISGCGKSLTAKTIATAWGIPLLRLDLGALKSKYVGESEQQLRNAFRKAETIAPCVCWVDELEKSLAGATGPQGDGGVGSDALGFLLNWMQERTAPVFLIATCNDVSGLPPEMLRKGRWDELFFVDLPTQTERMEVLAAALRQHQQEAGLIPEVARACAGFTGAEIAAIVPDALFAAFADGERKLTVDDMLEAAKSVVPLSKTAADKIANLRSWASGRARPASLPEASTVGAGRAIDM